MSLATLKKKTIASWNLSGRGNEQFVINKSSPGNPTFSLKSGNIVENDSQFRVKTGPGGGFSINGRYRNIGRVGQDMKMSKGLSRAVNISQGKNRLTNKNNVRVPQYKGWGGNIGKYDKNGASGKFGTGCCGESLKLVKPSVLSFKGMINLRNRWTQVKIPNAEIKKIEESSGYKVNLHSLPALKLSCNNWVKNTGGNSYVITNTAQQYIDYRVKPLALVCNPNKYSDVPRPNQPINNTYNCSPCSKPCRSCSYYIGSKYFPPTPFSKQITTSENSSHHYNYLIAVDGVLPSTGFYAAYPPTTTNGQCGNASTSILDVLETKLIQQKALDELKTGALYSCKKQFIKNYKIILDERGSNGTLSSIAF